MRIELNSREPRLLSSLLLVGALLAPAATSQDASLAVPSVRAPQEAEQASDEQLSARRILHLASGGTQTAVARFSDGHWEVKGKGGEWQAYPAGAVTRAPREAEVLREQKQRAKGVRQSGDLEEHLALITWMAEEGLVKECLQEADAILERSPNHAGTLEFLRSRPLIVVPSLRVASEDLAAATEEFFRWASNAPASVRELAIAELGRIENREALHSQLVRGLSDFSVRRRAFSAHALGRIFPGEDAKRLLQHAVLDASQDVRRQTAQALSNAEQPGLIVPVVRALGSSNIRVRVQAAEALGNMGYPAAVEPLVSYIAAAQSGGSTNRVPHGYIFVGKQTAYVQDFDVEVATFQAVADPQINVLLEGDVLEAGVSGVIEYSYATESRAARSSLGRLTGADPGSTGAAWQRWWEANGAEWGTHGLSRTD